MMPTCYNWCQLWYQLTAIYNLLAFNVNSLQLMSTYCIWAQFTQLTAIAFIWLQLISTYCFWCQLTAFYDNLLQLMSAYCIWYKLTASDINSLQLVSTHCNWYQLTAIGINSLQLVLTHCNWYQLTAFHINWLQFCMSFLDYLHIEKKALLTVARSPIVPRRVMEWGLISPNPPLYGTLSYHGE